MRSLLRGVERSSGSSGWLADLYREGERTGVALRGDVELRGGDQGDQRQADRATGRSRSTRSIPRTAYPSATRRSALSIAGAARRSRAFLPTCRLSCSRAKPRRGSPRPARRVELGRADPDRRPMPSHQFDPSRALTVVRPPEPAVIQKALSLYQEALRRPSLTALCIDVSGSMKGHGEAPIARSDGDSC